MSFLRKAGVGIALAAMAGGYAMYRIGTPYQGFKDATFVEFPHGTGTEVIYFNRSIYDANSGT
jgi:hypothetical protein